jgi:hypothetical protein
MEKAHKQSHHRYVASTDIPCAMVLTVSFALSPVNRACCHRHQRDAKHHRQLDASVEASGPHDFAVRIDARRLRASMRPSHPAPNVRDDREAPLLEERGTAETSGGDLPDGASRNIFGKAAGQKLKALDRGSLICPPRLGKNSVFSRVDVRFGDDESHIQDRREPESDQPASSTD